MKPLEPSKETVFIIDDSKFEINLLRLVLQDIYTIQSASNAQEALQLLHKNPLPDLIVLDVLMPNMDGFSLCKSLKENPSTKDIPIIFITAKVDAADETKGLEYGAVDYITKPFNPAIMKARIKTHLELKRRHDQLATLSSIDGLTQIPNRRRFDDFLDLEWNRAIREKIPLSVMLLDIDHFKFYNDHYGHIAGDECLKSVAHAVSTLVHRSTDLFARYGGEEFAIILPNTGITGIHFLSKAILAKIHNLNIPHEYSPVSSHVTCSIGGAAFIPSPDSSKTDFLNQVDKALYQSKTNGRNQFTSVDLRIPPSS